VHYLKKGVEIMSELNKFVKSSSRFLTISPGQSEVFTILAYQTTMSTFGNPTVAYKIQLPDGTEKLFQTSSVKFARAVLALPDEGIGAEVKVTRIGEGLKTTYNVEPVGAEPSDEPTPPEEPQPEEELPI